jgi:molybdopterin converting factor small subunit
VKVVVRYMAQARQAAGAASEQVEVDRAGSIRDLLILLADRHGDRFRDLLLNAAGGVRPPLLLFVGDEQVGADWPALRDGDVVTVLTPMAGG